MATALTPDNTSQDAIDDNLTVIKAAVANGDPIILPAGITDLPPEGLVLRNGGVKITGAGSGRSFLRCRGNGAATLGMLPDDIGISLAEEFTPDWNAKTLTFPAGTDMRHVGRGNAIYLYQYDSYRTGNPVNFRAEVQSVSGTKVKFKSPAGTGALESCDRFKRCEGTAILNARAGDDRVTLTSPGLWAAGQTVLVLDGATRGNEGAGDFRTVLSVAGRTIYLDYPLTRDLTTTAAIVAVNMLDGIEMHGLTVIRPDDPAAVASFSGMCRNLTMRDVGFEGQDGAFSSCPDLEIHDLSSLGGLRMNNCHDAEVRGGFVGGVKMEENCDNVRLRGLTVQRPGGMEHGVSSQHWTGCRRLSLDDVRIVGAGLNLGSGAGSPLSGGGPGSWASRVQVSLSRPGAAPCYLHGDDFAVSLSDSDVGVWMSTGVRQSLHRVRSPDLELLAPSRGRAIDCSAPTRADTGWRVD